MKHLKKYESFLILEGDTQQKEELEIDEASGEYKSTDGLKVGEVVDISSGVKGKLKYKAKIIKIKNEDYLTVEIDEDRPDIIDYFGDAYAKGKQITFPVSSVIPPSISFRK
jgi:hypothetical protein